MTSVWKGFVFDCASEQLILTCIQVVLLKFWAIGLIISEWLMLIRILVLILTVVLKLRTGGLILKLILLSPVDLFFQGQRRLLTIQTSVHVRLGLEVSSVRARIRVSNPTKGALNYLFPCLPLLNSPHSLCNRGFRVVCGGSFPLVSFSFKVGL